MALGNRCTKGTSCGATCIDPRERCVLELGPEINQSLSNVRDHLLDILEKQQSRDLDWSDEGAARWLKANQKFLETAETQFEGGKGSFWTFGLEPGSTLKDMETSMPAMDKKLLAEGKMTQERSLADNLRLAREEPSQVIRRIRDAFEKGKLVNKALGKKMDVMSDIRDPVVWKLIERGSIPTTMDVKKEVSEVGKDKRWRPSTYMAKAAKLANSLGMERWSNGNISMVASPDTNVWPAGDVFKRAGMDPGVFATRGTWLNYLKEGPRAGNIANAILEKKPEIVYLSGGEGRAIFQKLVDSGQVKTFERSVEWASGTGKPQKKTFLVAEADGTRVVFGPHFTAQNSKQVLEMRNALLAGKERGNPVNITKSVPEPKPAKVASGGEAVSGRKGVGGVWDEMVPLAAAAGIRAGERNAKWVNAQEAVRKEFGVKQLRKPEHLASLRRELQSRGLLSSAPSVAPGSSPKSVLKGDLAPSKVGEARKASLGMENWSTTRLQRAWQRAFEDGDEAKMNQIQVFLNQK